MPTALVYSQRRAQAAAHSSGPRVSGQGAQASVRGTPKGFGSSADSRNTGATHHRLSATAAAGGGQASALPPLGRLPDRAAARSSDTGGSSSLPPVAGSRKPHQPRGSEQHDGGSSHHAPAPRRASDNGASTAYSKNGRLSAGVGGGGVQGRPATAGRDALLGSLIARGAKPVGGSLPIRDLASNGQSGPRPAGAPFISACAPAACRHATSAATPLSKDGLTDHAFFSFSRPRLQPQSRASCSGRSRTRR